MVNSASSSGLLPLPGAASSSWALYASRVNAIFRHPDMKVIVAFWLFGALPDLSLILSRSVNIH